MDENDFTRVLSHSERVSKEKAVETLRPVSEELSKIMMEEKIISAIRGLRGVGKSSLLINVLKRSKKSIYINAEFLVRISCQTRL